MSLDIYHTLGVTPEADAATLKRAFRRAAMRWHPDRNPAPEAAQHFRALRSALEAALARLEAGHTGSTQNPENPQSSQNPESESTRRSAPQEESWSESFDIDIDLDLAYHGGTYTLERSELAPCAACQGSGRESLLHSQLCEACHGTGKLRQAGQLCTCAVCSGKGYLRERNCTKCAGSGEMRSTRQDPVQLPAGLATGDSVIVQLATAPGRAKAAKGRSKGAAQDLNIRLRVATVRPHPLFTLHGRNLSLERPVHAIRLLSGGAIQIPHPAGLRQVNIPPGRANAHTLRIAGAGLPARHAPNQPEGEHPAGDLLIRLQPVFPQGDTAALRTLLAETATRIESEFPESLASLQDWEKLWLA